MNIFLKSTATFESKSRAEMSLDIIKLHGLSIYFGIFGESITSFLLTMDITFIYTGKE